LQAALERLLMQLVAVQEELHSVSGGYGCRFRLSEHLHWAASAGPRTSENGAGGATNGDANGVTGMEIQENLDGLIAQL
jgi:hypothetical protein